MEKGSVIYLHQSQRRNFKKEIGFFKEFFELISHKCFDNDIIDKSIEKAISDGRKQYLKTPTTEYLNEFDYYNYGEIAGYKKYQYYEILKKNIKLSSISTVFQFWEQQVRKFLYSNFEINNMLGRAGSLKGFFSRGYIDFKNKLKDYIKIPENINLFENINNIHLLNNVIKHGQGRSEESLSEEKPEWLLKPSKYRDSFSSEGMDIDVNKINFDEICNILIDFWDIFPEKCVCINDYEYPLMPDKKKK